VNNSYKLPNIRSVSIPKHTTFDSQLELFFERCMPDKLRVFSLNYGYVSFNNISSYVNSLSKCLPSVSDQVFFYCSHFTKTQELNEIVKACRNSERLVIRAGNLHIDEECDFGENEYRLNTINFSHCNNCCPVGWAEKPERFENIVKGIAKSKLKDSIKIIGVLEINISKIEAEAILTKHGLSKVNVIIQSENPML
jgi:hypothetical protein